MLNCVDCFSRYAWSIATTNKRGPTILEGLKQIVKDNNNKYPAHLWVDQGSEFYNQEVKEWCNDHDITMYSTFGRAKSAIVERFNRTIKTLLYKHFYAVQNKRWVKILPQFIKEYKLKKRDLRMELRQYSNRHRLTPTTGQKGCAGAALLHARE